MIVIACDHGGIDLKNAIIVHLHGRENVIDLGTNSTESVDYPTYAFKAAERCVKENCKGIVICKSGVGVNICANKVNGVRCALCTNPTQAALSRKHNNANMLALGAAMVTIDEAIKIVESFLATEFEGGRHANRVDLITEYESTH